MADAMIPYLYELGAEAVISPEKMEKNKTLMQIYTTLKEWAASHSAEGLISFDLNWCNRSYTRFRTPFMDHLFPDALGTKSGWNSPNHCFYEIVNQTGNSAYIQLALSSKEMPQDQLEICDRINELYPSKNNKPEWKWRNPFRTESISIDDVNDKDAIFMKLDECLKSVWKFEEELKDKRL